jgi:excisionase family DNA binding protein
MHSADMHSTGDALESTTDTGENRSRRALTVREVAEQFGVSEAHIRRLVRTGQLAKVPHMGTRVVIAVGELDRVFGAAA